MQIYREIKTHVPHQLIIEFFFLKITTLMMMRSKYAGIVGQTLNVVELLVMKYSNWRSMIEARDLVSGIQ